MEKSLLFTVLCFVFNSLNSVSGFPINFSSLGAGEPSPIWLTSYFLTGIGFLLAIIGVIFGCICCRNGKGFKEFSNSSGSLATSRPEGFVNSTSTSELTIFPPAGSHSSQICRFEPLPDITPQAPNLRPAAFSYSEREISSQDWFSEPYNNFPRNQLKYVQEYGRGWFGRVVEGEAQNITTKEKLTKVMVKILHEDATPTDQMYFLHEVKFYRDLKHPNILRLLGRCLETEPFLIILENYPNGDLKTFLSQNLASARALVEQGVTLKMCSNITSGLQFMHENKFIHTDLAARNCLVGPDLSVKIGDYGNSIEIFKSDYYCAGSVALPVRWCAPETLKCTDVTIETREVTQPANIWSLAVVFWEICEFCKLPYAELNDDQVIVRVLGEKNYFLEKPNMFCLHKDELYHLMKLCWNPPLQRPTAAQINVILENLILSGRENQRDAHINSKRISQDFEQRWQNLKPNYIPKRDDASEVDPSPNCSIISSKLKNSKITDSSMMESPLGIFMSNENSGQDLPRFCLKSEKSKPGTIEENSNEGLKSGNSKSSAIKSEFQEPKEGKVEFEYSTEIKQTQMFNSNQNFKPGASDVDSWLKGVEINNEEDESFVRKISEAIRDLDATLAMEKTSSSEETSGKSSHQNSPGKDLKENETVVDFKLGSDTSSFMNFTQKSFELSSLQNTEQPQSLNFTDPFLKKTEFEENFGPSSLIMPLIEESQNKFNIKSDILDESLKEQDSLVYSQSRNSSDTDDEIWRKRIEKGEISEKVKEKSKSIANLMILTHIDASDDSDIDLDKPFEKGLSRTSFLRRSGSFAKSSLTSNNFGSENDLTHAVLEDEFKESLKKLSNDHKEYGRFDSLGMILPTSARRDDVWETFFKPEPIVENSKGSKPQIDVNTMKKNSEEEKILNSETKKDDKLDTDNRNNFLGDIASEKLNNVLQKNKNDDILDIKKEKDIVLSTPSKCDSNTCKAEVKVYLLHLYTCKGVRDISSHLKAENSEALVICKEISPFQQNNLENKANLSEEIEKVDVNNKDLITEVEKQESEKNETVENSPIKALKKENGADFRNSFKESIKMCEKKPMLAVIPEITMTEAEEDELSLIEEVYESAAPKIKPFRFVLKEKDFLPQITITEEPEEEVVEEQETNFEFFNKTPKSFKFVLKDNTGLPDKILENSTAFNTSKSFEEDSLGKIKPNDDFTVIIGACEDFTLDYFKGLKTNSEDISPMEEDEQNFQKVIEDLRNKEANLDVWDKHLETAFTQQLRNKDFNDISFKSLSSDFPEKENKAVEVSKPVMTSPIKTIANFIEAEKVHTEKLEESTAINSLTNLTELGSEEEYDNFKLRTPDDERSSDSGFRDKGSLSESVEDACEGKYNLEDIEAELEEAFVKGAFGNCDNEKEKEENKNFTGNCNFEYEESKFYEDENKNEEDFSDIDGEIEFWQSKDSSDYYPEISEFNPTCSQGWYLHPPDEAPLGFKRNVNEDLVIALRNELQETLPVQSRSFEEFNDFYESDFSDNKRELNIHYLSDFGIPLSPIIEEQDCLQETTKKNIKNSLFNGHNNNRSRENIMNIMESVKSINTNTFRLYLDYMIENEGKDLDDIEEVEEKVDENKDDEGSSPVLILEKVQDESNGNFEEDIKNALGSELTSRSESIVSDADQNNSALFVEDLESGCSSKIVLEGKTEDDILVVNVNTNEVTLLESPKPKTYMAFLESSEKKDELEIMMDNSENEGLIFTPEMLSPDRERSLSEISRSSNGTRSGDALSDITLSSPDLVPDCFSTSVHEIAQNNEGSKIMKALEDSGITNGVSTSEESEENNDGSASNITEKTKVQNMQFLLIERKFCSENAEEILSLQKNIEVKNSSEIQEMPQKTMTHTEDIYEMSTSFMGDYEDDDDESTQDAKADTEIKGCKLDKEVAIEDSYTADWESESSEGEEMSSSSGEFIWKDGDKESKVKAVHATECDFENSLSEKLQKSHNAIEITDVSSPIKEVVKEVESAEENEDDDNESSTGSSASITDFLPSAWNSQATPSRSALRSPDKKVDSQQKKSVWFKKQKYHCVYEYPREPSDNEENDAFTQFNFDKCTQDSPNKHFTFGVNTVELPNKHFPYGISNVIDYSSYTDWDVLEEEERDLSLTDTDSENGPGKSESNIRKENDFNFYNLSPFDYDFTITGTLNEESEFFVSSSSRPFQVSSSSQFFPGSNQIFNTTNLEEINSKDFATPDSGLEDSVGDTPIDKKSQLNHPNIIQMDNSSETKPGIQNLLDNLKINFNPEIVETNMKKVDLKSFGDNINSNQNGSSNGSSCPLNPLSSGLGELRHTRDKLKLDLPHNHNAELGSVINKKNHQNSLKL